MRSSPVCCSVTGVRTATEITRLGVLGWPVAHSRSPAMQNAALAAAGLTHWRYQLLPAPPDVFAEQDRPQWLCDRRATTGSSGALRLAHLSR